MIKQLITFAAFLSAATFVAPAMAADAIHQEFQTGIQKMQAQLQFENFKKTIDIQEQALRDKQKELHRSIQDDAVILRARLNELDYLSDFLNVDSGAKRAVEQSIELAQGPRRPDVQIAEASAVVALISGGAYALAKSEVPAAGDETPAQKAAKTKARAKANVFTRSLEEIRGSSTARNVSGVVLAASVVVVGAALVDNYFSGAPQRVAALNQSQVFLSKLASGGQQDYLTRAQVDQIFSQKPKDATFGNTMTVELNAILKDSDQRTSAINQKRTDIVQIDNQVSVLHEQVATQRSLIQQQASVAH